MDLNLLTTFLAVYKHSSITVASEQLDISQPAVSAAIKRLESVVGKALFVREGRGIAPTGAAVSLANKIEDPLNIIGTVEQQKNDLKVYCTESLLHFVSQVEGVSFTEAPLEEEELFDALTAQKVDIVIDVLSSKKHSLIEETIVDEEPVCLTRINHPRIGETLSKEEYFQEEHIALKIKRANMNTVEFLSESDIEPRKVRIETSSISSMLILASTTDYIAASTRSFAEMLAPALGLRVHPIPIKLKPLTFRMLYHRRYANDEQHIKTREAIKSALRKHK
ncbi:LysR family transcriptional regulator [Vibrio splendidus]|uniref:LysR family transcriptional regulator n=1 Tax=Vibrio splendidus TaxID=29497 RepID=UPI000808C23B|nr:LysR family transcriptional regulator [Vibrio splendidus]PMG26875.1 LysR family transcriptional regulator [Vibrio splendidus]SBS64789.1 HTH-type transcriptional regulator LeuO [Vibrio splendidus]